MGCPLTRHRSRRGPAREPGPTDSLWGAPSPGESRWPGGIAVGIIIALQMVLPEPLSFGPRIVLPIIELVLLITLVAANPNRFDEESRDLRIVSIGLIVVISAANAAALGLLIGQLVRSSSPLAGSTLMYSAVAIWATNIVTFGIWYWEIDRGGPIRRCMADHPRPDFIFPQMENPGVTDSPWSPVFFDYLYVSLTNSTAFSPTDTLPLTHRAKLLMSLQGVASLATIAILAARGVNILNGSK